MRAEARGRVGADCRERDCVEAPARDDAADRAEVGRDEDERGEPDFGPCDLLPL